LAKNRETFFPRNFLPLKYITRFRQASEECDFNNWNANATIKCLTIANMADAELRLSFLQKEHNLDEIQDKIQSKETALIMSKAMAGKPEDVKKVTNRQPKQKCNMCRYEKTHKSREECQAFGKTCNFCKRKHHISFVYFKKLVNQIEMKNNGNYSNTNQKNRVFKTIKH